ncbi:MAG: hypothetical protein AAGJ93_07335, partial [Bacteroidota bacterium]
GTSVDVTRNKESIHNVYESSIIKLINKFIEKGELFEKFYVRSIFRASVNNSMSINRKDAAIISIRNRISEKTHSIRLIFYYQAFNQVGFKEFNHSSQIDVEFAITRYHIKTVSGLSLEKLYGEQLTDEEITSLVNAEMRKHKALIDEEIKKTNERN